MDELPMTSVTLLKSLSADTASGRWADFLKIYEKPMRGFIAARFPSLASDADDVLQEALVALMKALPDYRYVPDGQGHFRNYLMGIVKHKATDALRKRAAESDKRTRAAEEGREASDEDDAWRRSAMEVALAQLFADKSLSQRNLEIFRHVAVLHESPESVAALFGVTRGNVDVIKKRLVDRLAEIVRRLVDLKI